MEIRLDLRVANEYIPTVEIENRGMLPLTGGIEFPEAPGYLFRWYFTNWSYEQGAEWREMHIDENGQYTIPFWFPKMPYHTNLHEELCAKRYVYFDQPDNCIYFDEALWVLDPTVNLPPGHTVIVEYDPIPEHIGVIEVPIPYDAYQYGPGHAQNPYCENRQLWFSSWTFWGDPMARVFWMPGAGYVGYVWRKICPCDVRPPVPELLAVMLLGAAMASSVVTRRKRCVI